MLIHLVGRHLLRVSASTSGASRLRDTAGGCPLPQTLLSEVDRLRLRDRTVGVVLTTWSGLILRLLLVEVHALLGCHRHAGFQISRELHVLACRHL